MKARGNFWRKFSLIVFYSNRHFVIFIYIIWKSNAYVENLFQFASNKEEFLAKASGCRVARLYDSKMSNSIDSRLSSLKELMSM